MLKKIGVMVCMVLTMILLSACKSNDNEYDEIIDQVFGEVQKFNDDEDYLYIHGGREVSNTHVYVLEGYEDEGLIIQVYYPYKEKKSGEEDYDEDWYVYENSTHRIELFEINYENKNSLKLSFQEININ